MHVGRMQYAPTLPAGEAGHKSRKIPPKEWTDIAPIHHHIESLRQFGR